MSNKLLVSGAAGQLGGAVVAHLLDTFGVDASRIVAGSRDPGKLADIAARGVATARVDFDDPASMAEAFAGIDTLLVISTDALGQPGKRLAQHKAAVAAAAKAGIRHIVYTSLINPEKSVIHFAPDHVGTEQALRDSGAGWTVLRNAWYMENLMAAIPSALESGTWYTASGTGSAGYVTRDDCARAAAAVLASGPTENAVHSITGPESLSVDDLVATLNKVNGTSIEVVQLDDAGFIGGLQAAGLPDILVNIISEFDRDVRAGTMAGASDAVKTLTGTAPVSFADFAATIKG
ncbi:NmrA family NAD(P)-binding protein [Rhodospirillaceae bacterium KN72]|uniref:NmrA family NAD(P)-binding protein n=1 Tax=Pacificispira spongiicola TaxID=2729598 RepID=A0A7Y0HGT8_9PROT|nr:NmrA family NAD(P)-binding protein [Pacificispira spongiicola]NMM45277.1 NmrA family NAD(P)-binding protein [Pacificispira spongiicola]